MDGWQWCLVGVNHVALKVGDLDAAFTMRGRTEGMVWLDLDDQFLVLVRTEVAAARPSDLR